MVYPYAVKHNGRYYAAGMEVPENGISVSALDEPEDQEAENTAEVKRRGRKPKTEE